MAQCGNRDIFPFWSVRMNVAANLARLMDKVQIFIHQGFHVLGVAGMGTVYCAGEEKKEHYVCVFLSLALLA